MLRSSDPEQGFSELARLRAAVEASGDILYDWDFAADVLILIGATDRLFGPEECGRPLSGETFNGRINPEDLPERLRALSEHIAGNGAYECEYRLRDERAEQHWVHDRGAVQFSTDGTPQRLVGVLRPITQRKQLEARLEYQASYDELTGHFNKLRLREALDQALAHSLRHGQSGAFIVIGVDQMGMLNAAYGHGAGDAVLFEIGQRLSVCLRSTDAIGRLGGDCFGIVLASCARRQAQATVERLLRIVRQTPVEIGGRQVHVTASASVVAFPTHSKTSFDLMTKAEGALFRAKEAGRDCVQWYEMSEEQRRGFQHHMDVGEQVKTALNENRLCLAYQPIVEASSGRERLYECLLRMCTPDGGMIAAAQFIPVVERLGLMRAIDRHALQLVLNDLTRHPEISLAVNISGLTAADRSWLRTLTAGLKGRADLARRLVIEITETAAMHDIEEIARFVSVVRELGCKVAVDDFGAGYTSFRHLKSLTVDVVKIDGSFVKGIGDSDHNQLFLRNLLGLAHAFGLETVAECVETAEDAEFLAREGVDLLQGFHFGAPRIDPAWRACAPAVQGPPAEEPGLPAPSARRAAN